MKEIIKNIYHIAVSIAILVVTLLGLDYYIEYKIMSRINDHNTINKIASEIRPSLVFDLKGSVVYDIGGMERILTPPKVEARHEKGHTPMWTVTINPKKNLKIAPIVECINEFYNVKGDRGIGNEWKYEIEPIDSVTWSRPEIIIEPLFRMEIIQ